MLTQAQENEVRNFQSNLHRDDEWLFFHLAYANRGEKEAQSVSLEDKYKIMKRWNELRARYQ